MPRPALAAAIGARPPGGLGIAFLRQYQQAGLLEALTGLTPGATYWLSAATAGQLVTTKPATGYAQVIMSAMTGTRAIVSVGPVQAVDGVVRLRPTQNGNVIQGLAANVVPIQLRRRADQLADLLTVESETGTILGAFDKNGVPTGTLAPPVLLPPGCIMYFFGTTAPTGWIMCDGGAIPVQYTVLRALFGTTMPDWRGRFVIAAHPTSFPAGNGGGAYSVALAAGNMPAALQIVTDLRKVMKLNRHHSLFKQGRLSDSLAEHRLMMAALQARDAPQAAALDSGRPRAAGRPPGGAAADWTVSSHCSAAGFRRQGGSRSARFRARPRRPGGARPCARSPRRRSRRA